MITYNHESFIREVIESTLMQKTNFSFELVIGEDYSTDNTRNICLEYQKKYPNKIKILCPKKNLGMIANFKATLNACKGKYIALCEGDDYWTDSYKLQKQIDFLEANPEYVMCFHKAEIKQEIAYNSSSKLTYKPANLLKQDITTEDLIKEWLIPTASVVFRRQHLPPFYEWFYKVISMDIPLLTLIADKGKVRYIPDIMSVYRKHEGGISLGHRVSPSFFRNRIYMYRKLYKHLDKKNQIIILKKILSYYNNYYLYNKEKKRNPNLINNIMMIKYYESKIIFKSKDISTVSKFKILLGEILLPRFRKILKK